MEIEVETEEIDGKMWVKYRGMRANITDSCINCDCITGMFKPEYYIHFFREETLITRWVFANLSEFKYVSSSIKFILTKIKSEELMKDPMWRKKLFLD